MLGEKMIRRVEPIHSQQIIHLDLEPDNPTRAIRKNQHLVYAIDFRLDKQDTVTILYKPYKERKQLTGTALYFTIYTHLQIEQSRRDDLKSIGYALLYFLKSALPWQEITFKTKKEKYEKIKQQMQVLLLRNFVRDRILTYLKKIQTMHIYEISYSDYL